MIYIALWLYHRVYSFYATQTDIPIGMTRRPIAWVVVSANVFYFILDRHHLFSAFRQKIASKTNQLLMLFLKYPNNSTDF